MRYALRRTTWQVAAVLALAQAGGAGEAARLVCDGAIANSGEAGDALEIGHNLAVARGRKQGLLINPHMEAWLSVPQETK